MPDKDRVADYLRRSREARAEARRVMDPLVRESLHRVGDEYERIAAQMLRDPQRAGVKAKGEAETAPTVSQLPWPDPNLR